MSNYKHEICILKITYEASNEGRKSRSYENGGELLWIWVGRFGRLLRTASVVVDANLDCSIALRVTKDGALSRWMFLFRHYEVRFRSTRLNDA